MQFRIHLRRRISFVCPECAHEWNKEVFAETEDGEKTAKDANGNLLKNGDSITVIKDLKIKGSSQVVKVGTKIKNIRLIDDDNSDGEHNIDCKVAGVGGLKLTSKYVKKI